MQSFARDMNVQIDKKYILGRVKSGFTIAASWQ